MLGQRATQAEAALVLIAHAKRTPDDVRQRCLRGLVHLSLSKNKDSGDSSDSKAMSGKSWQSSNSIDTTYQSDSTVAALVAVLAEPPSPTRLQQSSGLSPSTSGTALLKEGSVSSRSAIWGMHSFSDYTNSGTRRYYLPWRDVCAVVQASSQSTSAAAQAVARKTTTVVEEDVLRFLSFAEKTLMREPRSRNRGWKKLNHPELLHVAGIPDEMLAVEAEGGLDLAASEESQASPRMRRLESRRVMPGRKKLNAAASDDKASETGEEGSRRRRRTSAGDITALEAPADGHKHAFLTAKMKVKIAIAITKQMRTRSTQEAVQSEDGAEIGFEGRAHGRTSALGLLHSHYVSFHASSTEEPSERSAALAAAWLSPVFGSGDDSFAEGTVWDGWGRRLLGQTVMDDGIIYSLSAEGKPSEQALSLKEESDNGKVKPQASAAVATVEGPEGGIENPDGTALRNYVPWGGDGDARVRVQWEVPFPTPVAAWDTWMRLQLLDLVRAWGKLQPCGLDADAMGVPWSSIARDVPVIVPPRHHVSNESMHLAVDPSEPGTSEFPGYTTVQHRFLYLIGPLAGAVVTAGVLVARTCSDAPASAGSLPIATGSATYTDLSVSLSAEVGRGWRMNTSKLYNVVALQAAAHDTASDVPPSPPSVPSRPSPKSPPSSAGTPNVPFSPIHSTPKARGPMAWEENTADSFPAKQQPQPRAAAAPPGVDTSSSLQSAAPRFSEASEQTAETEEYENDFESEPPYSPVHLAQRQNVEREAKDRRAQEQREEEKREQEKREEERKEEERREQERREREQEEEERREREREEREKREQERREQERRERERREQERREEERREQERRAQEKQEEEMKEQQRRKEQERRKESEVELLSPQPNHEQAAEYRRSQDPEPFTNSGTVPHQRAAAPTQADIDPLNNNKVKQLKTAQSVAFMAESVEEADTEEAPEVIAAAKEEEEEREATAFTEESVEDDSDGDAMSGGPGQAASEVLLPEASTANAGREPRKPSVPMLNLEAPPSAAEEDNSYDDDFEPESPRGSLNPLRPSAIPSPKPSPPVSPKPLSPNVYYTQRSSRLREPGTPTSPSTPGVLRGYASPPPSAGRFSARSVGTADSVRASVVSGSGSPRPIRVTDSPAPKPSTQGSALSESSDKRQGSSRKGMFPQLV